MNTSEKRNIIRKTIKNCEKFEKERNKLMNFLSIDSDFLNSIHACIENYIQLTSKLVGDENEWIEWYIYENKFGKNKLNVIITDKSQTPNKEKSFIVDNVSKLIKIMEK